MKGNTRLFDRVVMVALVASGISTSEAANRFWTNTAGGSWEAPGNWSPNGSPTNTDSIYIQANGTYTINFDDTTVDTGSSNDWLTVFETRLIGDGVGGVPTLLVDFTNTAKQLTLLYTGGDALQAISGGNLILNNGRIGITGGYLIGSTTTGTATMTGGALAMGAGSTITKFGTFTQSGGSQNGTVFFIGGLLNLFGGSHNSSGSFVLGNGAADFGTVIIDGGALTNTATFYIGNSGRGLVVLSNGVFHGNNMSFGDNGGFGAGGDWNIYGGSASLGGNLTIGTAGQSTGAVLIAGGSLGVSGLTTVGSGGLGTMILSNGSFSGSSLSISGPSSRVEQHGGTINLTGNLTVNASAGQTGRVVTTAGTMSVGGSATIGLTQNGEWLISGGSNAITGSLSFADSGTGSRGTIVMNGGSLTVGGTTYMPNSGRATFIISNGTFTANAVSMSDNGNGGGDWTIVGGSGSVGGTFRIGNQLNATSTVTVANSGLLEIKSSTTLGHASAGKGTLAANNSGTLRFTGQNNPSIVIHAGSTATLNNATLEFKDASAAAIFGNVNNITRSGNNTLSLNHSTNASVSTFTADDAGSGAYKTLKLDNGSRFRATELNVGTGGEVRGGAGDAVEIGGNLNITRPSNPSGAFDLSASTVEFTGGVNHTNLITGDDLGNDGALGFGDGFTAVNFGIGRLKLSASLDHVFFDTGDSSASNALYALVIDVPGLSDAAKLAVATNNLHAPVSINIYYGFSGLTAENAFLNDQVYTLPGGGLLLPAVPEPTSLTLLVAIGAGMLLQRRARNG